MPCRQGFELSLLFIVQVALKHHHCHGHKWDNLRCVVGLRSLGQFLERDALRVHWGLYVPEPGYMTRLVLPQVALLWELCVSLCYPYICPGVPQRAASCGTADANSPARYGLLLFPLQQKREEWQLPQESLRVVSTAAWGHAVTGGNWVELWGFTSQGCRRGWFSPSSAPGKSDVVIKSSWLRQDRMLLSEREST